MDIATLIESPWERNDWGSSPVGVRVKGKPEFGDLVKVYVTEYRKRDRSPAHMAVLQLIETAPEMLNALRQAECAVEELCQGQDPANQCWVILGLVRSTVAKAMGAAK